MAAPLEWSVVIYIYADKVRAKCHVPTICDLLMLLDALSWYDYVPHDRD